MFRTSPLGIMLAALTLTACDPAGPAGVVDGDELGTGMRLSVQHFLDSDVIGYHFRVDRVACHVGESFEPFQTRANVDLINGFIDGNIDLLAINPLDPMSRRLGADLFMSVDPGCYEVVAAPARAFDGPIGFAPSLECSAATSEAIIRPGLTTEILLVNQCEGQPTGGIDSVAVLNHPPSLEVVIPEKIGLECVQREVCVLATDPNDDPIRVELQQVEGPELFNLQGRGPRVVDFVAGARVWETCFDITPEFAGTYEFRALVRDFGWRGDQLVPMESISGNPSRDTLRFPFHTIWEEAICIAEDGSPAPWTGEWAMRAPGCEWTDAQQHYCDEQNVPSIVDFVCDAQGNLIWEAVYPECADGIVTPPGDDDDDDDDHKGDDDDDDDVVTPPGDDDDDDKPKKPRKPKYPPGDDDDDDDVVTPPGDDDDDDDDDDHKGDDDDDDDDVTPPGDDDDDDDDHKGDDDDDDDDDVTPPGDDDDDDDDDQVRDGRMTGGGTLFTADGTRVTFGMNMRCDPDDHRFNLQINWGQGRDGRRFHLESIEDVVCLDTGVDPSPPTAPFDTLEGSGFGRLNNVSGARVEFSFTDAGEPGRSDQVTLRVFDGQTLVLEVSGDLIGGNVQAHR